MKRHPVASVLWVNLVGITILVILHFQGDSQQPTNPNFSYARPSDPLVPIIQRLSDAELKRQQRQIVANGSVELSPDDILSLIGPIPRMSESDHVDHLGERIKKTFQRLKQKNNTDTILILTPIHNIGQHLFKYTTLLKSLTYPRHLISVALGEDDSNDDTVAVAKNVIDDLQKAGFLYAKLFTFNLSISKQVPDNLKHDGDLQLKRRNHLALARNRLLADAYTNQDWVLWIDSDLSKVPPDLVEQLLYPNKDVVVPCCLFDDSGDIRVYDKNTWRETSISLEAQKHMSKDELVLEGYRDTTRIYLPHLRPEGRLVPLDGVGGCSLLIRAKCHKDGLNFPPKVYNHHIETEGLAKMAKSMGYGVYGLPFVEVFH